MTTGRINQVFNIEAPLPWHRHRFNNALAPATELSSLSHIAPSLNPHAQEAHSPFYPPCKRRHCKTSSSSPLAHTPPHRRAQDPQRIATISSLPGTSQPPPPKKTAGQCRELAEANAIQRAWAVQRLPPGLKLKKPKLPLPRVLAPRTTRRCHRLAGPAA